ncbi:MAG: 50S ribosomal protein L21, partial [Candidatus Omnitrophota bacterium]
GAKQYRVEEGSIIEVEKQAAEEGKEVKLDKVLLVSKDKKIQIGQPYLKDAKVSCVVLKQMRGKKAVSFKYRRRKSSHWSKGHRQYLTKLKIKDINIA